MALRQTIPKFRCDTISDARRILPQAPAYSVVELTDVRNLRRVVEHLVRNRCVDLVAKYAIGKTTVLPIELAKITNEMVVLVLPYHQLATLVYDRVSRSKSVTRVRMWTKVEDVESFPGLVITYAGCLAAYWLQEQHLTFPRCFLLHDECHEIGAFTGLLDIIGPTLSDVISYVRMSATGEENVHNASLPNVAVKEMQYVASSFLDPWSVEELGAPWSISSMNGNIILYEDDIGRAKELIQAYNMGGVACFHWTSSTPPEIVLANCREMAMCTDRHFAIVADSTYRSGYSLPVTIVVDSGRVKRLGVDAGKAVVYDVRGITSVESGQARWRAGRTSFTSALYWRPSGSLVHGLPSMHSTDVEALSAMLLALGFRVDSHDTFSNTIAGKGMVPKDYYFSLSGDSPLAVSPKSSMCKASEFNNSSHASGTGEFTNGEADDDDFDEEAEWVRNLRANLRNLSMFEDVEPISEVEDVPDMGSYLAADGVDGKLVNDVFPDGVTSVLRILDAKDSDKVVLCWNQDVRVQALYLLLNAYNSNNVQLRGSAKALAFVRQNTANVDSETLRDWATKVSEGVLQLTVAAEKYYGLILFLSKARHKLRVADFDLSDQEDVFKDYLVKTFNRSMRRRSSTARSSAGSTLSTVSENSSASCTYSRTRKKSLTDYPGYSKKMHFVYWAAGAPKKRYRKDLQRHEEWLEERSNASSSAGSSIRGVRY